MPVVSLISYILATGMTALALLTAFRLVQRGKSPYLQTYLYFIGAFLLSEFLNLVILPMVFFIVGPRNNSAFLTMQQILLLMLMPLLALTCYFLVVLLWQIRGRVLPSWFRFSFLAFWAMVFVLLLWITVVAMGSGDFTAAIRFNRILDRLLSAYFIGLPLAVFALSRWHRRGADDELAGRFALFIALPYLIYYLIPFYSVIYKVFPASRPLPMLVVAFAQPWPSLWFWRRRLAGAVEPVSTAAPLLCLDAAGLERFAEHYGLSRREREILALVVAGKSNKEIEDELFISLNTVKTHLYKIYAKLNVKNRLQVSNKVREYLQAD